MGVMSPASGRETATISSNTRAASGTRSDADAEAARTSGRRSGSGSGSSGEASPSGLAGGGIRA
nr:unnamed protein product [Digitaria exilis]